MSVPSVQEGNVHVPQQDAQQIGHQRRHSIRVHVRLKTPVLVTNGSGVVHQRDTHWVRSGAYIEDCVQNYVTPAASIMVVFTPGYKTIIAFSFLGCCIHIPTSFLRRTDTRWDQLSYASGHRPLQLGDFLDHSCLGAQNFSSRLVLSKSEDLSVARMVCNYFSVVSLTWIRTSVSWPAWIQTVVSETSSIWFFVFGLLVWQNYRWRHFEQDKRQFVVASLG